MPSTSNQTISAAEASLHCRQQAHLENVAARGQTALQHSASGQTLDRSQIAQAGALWLPRLPGRCANVQVNPQPDLSCEAKASARRQAMATHTASRRPQRDTLGSHRPVCASGEPCDRSELWPLVELASGQLLAYRCPASDELADAKNIAAAPLLCYALLRPNMSHWAHKSARVRLQ